MRISYAGASMPSALAIASQDHDIELVRNSNADINWGRADSRATLNGDISNTTNKRVMRERFKRNDVPMPTLLTLDEAVQAIANGRTLVGRPDRHTQGRGFWKISTIPELLKALRGTARKRAATHFMEFVDAPREYRVHIFKGKSIRISEKLYGLTGETAHGAYITGKPRHEVGHVRAAAKQAVEAVGLDFGAVDVLASDTECWVLEVNAAPGLGGSMPALYAETFKRWERGDWS